MPNINPVMKILPGTSGDPTGSLTGTHLAALNPDPLLEWTAVVDRGHEDRDGGKDLLLIVSSAPERSRGPPVYGLNDVLRIRFCHLRTRRSDTLRSF